MSRSKQLRFTASKIDRTLRYYQTKAFKKIAANQCALNRVRNERKMKNNQRGEVEVGLTLLVILVIGLLVGAMYGIPSFERYQTRAYAQNEVLVNEIKIKQTQQLVQVEQQKAQIRVADANGIAEAQKIINATLTDRYLQHEAIQAQEHMANSPNHTEIYIPSGNNGIPLVKTVGEDNKGNQ